MQDTREKILLEYMPENVRKIVDRVYNGQIEEVRIRLDMPLCICVGGESFMLGESGFVSKSEESYYPTKEDIETGLSKITEASYYSFENEIKNGFVTIYGGHRIGIGGRGVVTNGEIVSICDVSSLNFRFARQILNCADDAVCEIKDGKNINNTLIVSPPCYGKTTLLREVMRKLSNLGFKVCAIDERGELCAMAGGVPYYDIGINTDVYCGLEKAVATRMAIRSLSPQVVIMDELGTAEDIECVKYASTCGVGVIATMHGKCMEDLKEKFFGKSIFGYFQKIIYLGKNKRIIKVEGEKEYA